MTIPYLDLHRTAIFLTQNVIWTNGIFTSILFPLQIHEHLTQYENYIIVSLCSQLYKHCTMMAACIRFGFCGWRWHSGYYSSSCSLSTYSYVRQWPVAAPGPTLSRRSRQSSRITIHTAAGTALNTGRGLT